jgi:hypothetical protein
MKYLVLWVRKCVVPGDASETVVSHPVLEPGVPGVVVSRPQLCRDMQMKPGVQSVLLS